MPKIFDRKETSSPELPKSPIFNKLHEVQTESQEPKLHSEATKLVQIESEEPEPQIEGPEPEANIQNEDSGIH